VHLGRRGRKAHHQWDRGAVHIGVDEGDRVSLLRQGDGEIGRHGRFAHPSLAAGDGDGTGPGAWAQEGVYELVAIAQSLRHGVALLARHGVELHLDAAPFGDCRKRLFGLGADLVPQWAAGGREHDRRTDALVIEDDVSHHAEVDDVALELRVLNGGESPSDVFMGHVCLRRSRSALVTYPLALESSLPLILGG